MGSKQLWPNGAPHVGACGIDILDNTVPLLHLDVETILYITAPCPLDRQNEYVRVLSENPNNTATVSGGLQHITDDGDVSFSLTKDADIYAVNCHSTLQI